VLRTSNAESSSSAHYAASAAVLQAVLVAEAATEEIRLVAEEIRSAVAKAADVAVAEILLVGAVKVGLAVASIVEDDN